LNAKKQAHRTAGSRDASGSQGPCRKPERKKACYQQGNQAAAHQVAMCTRGGYRLGSTKCLQPARVILLQRPDVNLTAWVSAAGVTVNPRGIRKQGRRHPGKPPGKRPARSNLTTGMPVGCKPELGCPKPRVDGLATQRKRSWQHCLLVRRNAVSV
jgi:hypothetical protein